MSERSAEIHGRIGDREIKPLSFKGPQTLEGIQLKHSQLLTARDRLNEVALNLGRVDQPGYSEKPVIGYARLNRDHYAELTPDVRAKRNLTTANGRYDTGEIILPKIIDPHIKQIEGIIAEVGDTFTSLEHSHEVLKRLKELQQIAPRYVDGIDIQNAENDVSALQAKVDKILGKTEKKPAQEPPFELKKPITPEGSEREEKPIGVTLLNAELREIDVEGKRVKFNEGITWNLVILLSKINDPEKQYSVAELNEIALALGAVDINRRTGQNLLNNLKARFPADFLVASGPLGQTKYSINANFEGFENVKNETVEKLLKELGLTKSTENQAEELSEEEKQRRQKLLDTLGKYNLTDLEKQAFEVTIPYSEVNLLRKKVWAQMACGSSDALAIDRLQKRVASGKRKIADEIEVVTFWPEGRRRGQEAAFYLKLKEAQPAPPAAKKVFGVEPVSDVILNLLNKMTDNPNMSLKEAIELRGTTATGKPFHRGILRFSLNSAVNVLIHRLRGNNLAPAERDYVERVHTLMGAEDGVKSLQGLKQNIENWIKEGTPIIPAKEEEKKETLAEISLINEQTREIALDGNRIRFRKDAKIWDLLVFFARLNDPEMKFSADQLNEISSALTDDKVGSHKLNRLRKSFKNDGYKIFANNGTVGDPEYQVNAKFSGFESIKNEAVEKLLEKYGKREDRQYPPEIQAQIDAIEGDLVKLRLSLEATASEPHLNEKIRRGIEEREQKLAELMQGINTDHSEENERDRFDGRSLPLLFDYDPYFGNNLANIIADINTKNSESWNAQTIFEHFRVDPQYVRSIAGKGFLGVTGSLRTAAFSKAEVAQIIYIYRNKETIKREADNQLAQEIRKAAEGILGRTS